MAIITSNTLDCLLPEDVRENKADDEVIINGSEYSITTKILLTNIFQNNPHL